MKYKLLFLSLSLFFVITCSKTVRKDLAVIDIRDGIVKDKMVIDYSDEEGYPVKLSPIYFEYNSFEIVENDKLDNICEILLESNIKIRIIGHCDNRGGSAYNLVLGDARACAVKAFLVSFGIQPNRIKTFSYGEERPICFDDNISCWAKNRRTDFEIEN